MTTCRSPQCAVSLRVTSRPSRGEGTWASWAASPPETVLPHLKILGRCGIVHRTTTKQTLWLNKMRYCHSDLNPDAPEFIPWTSMPWLEVITYATDASESPKSEVAFREDVATIFQDTLDTFRHSCCLGSPALNWNLLNNPSGGTLTLTLPTSSRNRLDLGIWWNLWNLNMNLFDPKLIALNSPGQ